VVRVTPYGKVSWYPENRRLGRHQGQSGCFGEEKGPCPVDESILDTSAIQPLV